MQLPKLQCTCVSYTRHTCFKKVVRRYGRVSCRTQPASQQPTTAPHCCCSMTILYVVLGAVWLGCGSYNRLHSDGAVTLQESPKRKYLVQLHLQFWARCTTGPGTTMLMAAKHIPSATQQAHPLPGCCCCGDPTGG